MDAYPIEAHFPDIAVHAPGNTGIPFVHTFDSGVAGPHVMVNALTHGNEVCGAIVVDELLRARPWAPPRQAHAVVCERSCVCAFRPIDAGQGALCRPGLQSFVDRRKARRPCDAVFGTRPRPRDAAGG